MWLAGQQENGKRRAKCGNGLAERGRPLSLSDRERILRANSSCIEPLSPIGTSSTASSSFLQSVWDAGGTRPYHMPREVYGGGGRSSPTLELIMFCAGQ